jgi:hypothetical protein
MTDENLTEIAEQVTKQKRPKKSEQMSVQTKPGDNTKYLTNAMRIANLPKIDTKDTAQLQARIEEYFSICAEDDMKPSVAGLALAIGVDRKTIWQWTQSENSDRSNTIKRAYAVLDLMMNDYMQNGKINPVSGIFLMKNNFGYQDKQDVVITPNNPLGEKVDRKQLENKYIESVAEEIPEE